MNRTLKETLTKYVLETDGNCVDLLLFAPTKGVLNPLLQKIHSMWSNLWTATPSDPLGNNIKG